MIKAIVTDIFDADTIEINEYRIIRLTGIDAPEKTQPFFSESLTRISELIPIKSEIELEFNGIDFYKRTVGVGFIPTLSLKAIVTLMKYY